MNPRRAGSFMVTKTPRQPGAAPWPVARSQRVDVDGHRHHRVEVCGRHQLPTASANRLILEGVALAALGGQRLPAGHSPRIAKAIDERLLKCLWLQADDTGFPVQDGTDGKLRKGRLWAVTDQQEVRYHFTDTKEGKNPAHFLADFTGKLLLVDGGSEFNLAVAEKGLLRAGCWSHLRRYFFDARHHHPKEANLALGTFRDLFAIEAGLVGAPIEVVREVRNRDARPLVEGLFAWLTGLRLTVRPTSLLGEAIGYALNGREFFTRFLDHPELPMHNNRSELALRGPVVGRKQWLFAGSEGGAQAAATMFTLIGSCMMQGIDPWTYLADVLTRIGSHPVNRVHELTPRAWRLAREAASAASTTSPGLRRMGGWGRASGYGWKSPDAQKSWSPFFDSFREGRPTISMRSGREPTSWSRWSGTKRFGGAVTMRNRNYRRPSSPTRGS